MAARRLLPLGAAATLAACMLAGAGAAPAATSGASGAQAGDGACRLLFAPAEGGFALTVEVAADFGPGDWRLTVLSRDGSIRVQQSGPLDAGGGQVASARLPGKPADYDLALTVTRTGQSRICPAQPPA